MKRNIMRFPMWVGIALLLALLLISGCTRSKSSGPSATATEEPGTQAATQPPSLEPEPTVDLTGDEALAATTTAWALETATALAQTVEETAVAPTDTPEPTESPEPTEAPQTGTPEPTEMSEAEASPEPTATSASGTPVTHIVQPGENLFRIALEYGLSYQALATANKIVNPNLIFVGQKLSIPQTGTPGTPPATTPGVHIVQPGENLFRIALKYNMVFTVLANANGLSYPYTIFVGQRLTIP